ncbi:unnamed protein product [Thelazia callipaeda]|uniref:SH2 domain-containing protein n=1 Tax=Thelazia callipaeda TaxID=103827 RepID=A0A0N5D7Q7_THECL|nr:unnamed protein product [Thelazia callipaeda]
MWEQKRSIVDQEYNQNFCISRDGGRKSKSAHDLSPDKVDRCSVANAGTANKLNTLNTPNPNFCENESILFQSCALEPKKFYVYQTRAERGAEKNVALSNFHLPTTYRTSGLSWYNSNYPVSTYSVDYRSRHDDNYLHRRNNAYDVDTGSKPIGRRITSVLGDLTRRKYVRSNSMDRNALRSGDADYLGFRNRLLVPESHSFDKEYSYVNYHDTAARGSTPHEPDQSKVPTRSILKNKEISESDNLASDILAGKSQCTIGEKNQASSTSGMKHMFHRLKRHLSVEKSTNPGLSTISSHDVTYQNHFPLLKNTNVSDDIADRTQVIRTCDEGMADGITSVHINLIFTYTPILYLFESYSNVDVSDTVSKEGPSKASKKRSLFLALGRRRTTEMRLVPDEKIIIASGVEPELKRPSSPIEKIKSLFRRSKESEAIATISQPLSSGHSHNNYLSFPSTTSARYGLSEKPHSIYPLPHLPSMVGRETFTPQYRKYATGMTVPGSSIVNHYRYSYTPGTNDRALLHWHHEPKMF